MTANELYNSWQQFYLAGKGKFTDWYKQIGRPNGAPAVMPLVLLQFAAREMKETGSTHAQMTIKYGATIAPDTGDGVKEALGGLVSGFAAGGPAGAVIGFAGGVIASNAKQKAAVKEVKNQVAQIKTGTAPSSASTVGAVSPGAGSTLQASVANLLNFKGAELWVLSGLIILALILFFGKK